MARIVLKPGFERELKVAIRPTMSKLGNDIKEEWKAQIDVESGEMKNGTFSDVDNDSVITIGTITSDGHGYWEEMGSSRRPADPKLLPTAMKPRGDLHA